MMVKLIMKTAAVPQITFGTTPKYESIEHSPKITPRRLEIRAPRRDAGKRHPERPQWVRNGSWRRNHWKCQKTKAK